MRITSGPRVWVADEPSLDERAGSIDVGWAEAAFAAPPPIPARGPGGTRRMARTGSRLRDAVVAGVLVLLGVASVSAAVTDRAPTRPAPPRHTSAATLTGRPRGATPLRAGGAFHNAPVVYGFPAR